MTCMIKGQFKNKKGFRASSAASSEASFTEKYIMPSIRRFLLKDASQDYNYAMWVCSIIFVYFYTNHCISYSWIGLTNRAKTARSPILWLVQRSKPRGLLLFRRGEKTWSHKQVSSRRRSYEAHEAGERLCWRSVAPRVQNFPLLVFGLKVCSHFACRLLKKEHGI